MGRNEVSQSLLVQVRVLKNREMLLNMHALTGTFINSPADAVYYQSQAPNVLRCSFLGKIRAPFHDQLCYLHGL